MHYFEDCIDMIEQLPEELREKLTDMRELDLQVQSSMDHLSQRVNAFFSAAPKMDPNEKEAEFESIKKDYDKNLKNSDDKVQMANQMYDIVARYLKRVDQEMHKFKMDLEVGRKGITEIIEKRALEAPPAQSTQKDIRYSPKKKDKKRGCSSSGGQANLNNPSISSMLETPWPAVSFTPGRPMGPGERALAAAVSQAIMATQMRIGRRTTGLKPPPYGSINSRSASNEGGSTGASAQEISIRRVESTGVAQTASIDYTIPRKESALVPGTSTLLIEPPAPLQSLLKPPLYSSHFFRESTVPGTSTPRIERPAQLQSRRKPPPYSSNFFRESTVPGTSTPRIERHAQLQSCRKPPPYSSNFFRESTVPGTSTPRIERPAQLQSRGKPPPYTSNFFRESTVPGTSTPRIGRPAPLQSRRKPPPYSSYNPNEPTYCICNEVSYGMMVACDNKFCLYEWFHYPCVGIKEEPKGEWYCPHCTGTVPLA